MTDQTSSFPLPLAAWLAGPFDTHFVAICAGSASYCGYSRFLSGTG